MKPEVDENAVGEEVAIDYKVPTYDRERIENAMKNDKDEAKWAEKLLNKDKQAKEGPDPEWYSYSDKAVVVTKITFKVNSEDHDDIVFDLTDKDALKKLEKEPVVFKEGITFTTYVTFGVKGDDPVSRLTYYQKMTRLGIQFNKDTCVIGSFSPNRELVTMTLMTGEIPSGITSRAKYFVTSTITDDDKNNYLSFSWTMKVSKTWGSKEDKSEKEQ